MESEIRKMPKSKLRKIKEMSPYQIDELVLLGFVLLNESRRENNEETETIFTIL